VNLRRGFNPVLTNVRVKIKYAIPPIKGVTM
jgi:hypothetical protein